MAPQGDKLTVGSKVVIAQDTDIRGQVTIGTESVVHPKASILAIGGPITIGQGNVIEENAVIINLRKATMRIGDHNYFEVGSRVEAAAVGSHNTFEVKSFIGPAAAITDFVTIGAGTSYFGDALWPLDAEKILKEPTAGKEADGFYSSRASPLPPVAEDDTDATAGGDALDADQEEDVETIPSRTVIFGHDSRRRIWSGEVARQQQALHAKHLDYLRESIPKSNKLKLIH